MKILAVFLSALFLCASLFLFWTSDEQTTLAGGPTAALPGSGSGGDQGSAANLSLTKGEQSGPPPIRYSAGNVDVNQPLEVAPWGDLEGDFIEVRVVRAGDQTGLPAATVHVVLANDEIEDPEDAESLRGENLDLYLARFTRRFLADGDGIARIPKQERQKLYGFAPGLAGELTLEHDDDEQLGEPVELVLLRDFTFVVLVEGRGESVPSIDVQLTTEPDRRNRTWAQAIRRTDDAGLARFSHAGLLLRNSRDREGKRQYIFRLAIPLTEPALVTIPLLAELEKDAAPELEFVIQAPPTGSLSITVVDPKHESFSSTGSVRLVKLGQEADHMLRYVEGHLPLLIENTTDPTERELVAGRALFEHVGLGLDLGLRVKFVEERDPAADIVRGPSVRGEVKHVQVIVGPIATVLVGRLVDVRNQPLGERKFNAQLQDDNGQRVWDKRTDSDGNFRLRFEPHQIPEQSWSLSIQPSKPEPEAAPKEGEQPSESVAAENPGGDPEEEEPGASDSTEATLSTPDPAGEEAFFESMYRPIPGQNDLGTLICAPRPLLAAGRVVDEVGEGVEDVTVSTALQLSSINEPDQLFSMPLGAWSPHIDHSAESDSSGHFELFGRLETVRSWPGWSSRPVLSASAPGIAGNGQVTFRAGDAGLLLHVTVAGTLEGSVAIEDELLLEHLRISLRGGGPGNEISRDVVIDGTDFSADGLLPGPWELVIESQSRREVFRRITNIQVPRGAKAEDERLEGIDLSDLQLLRLDVQSSIAEEFDKVELARRLPGDLDWRSSENLKVTKSDEAQFLQVLTAHPGLDLHLLAKRHRPLEVINISSDRSVVLNGGILVALDLKPDLLRLLGSNIQLSVQIQRQSEGNRQRWIPFRGYSSDQGSSVQRISEHGRYLVRAYLTGNRENHERSYRRRTYSHIALEQELVIPDSIDPQRFEVALTRAALLDALDKLNQ